MELLPCPFCGSPGEVYKYESNHHDMGMTDVSCTNDDCGARIRVNPYPAMSLQQTANEAISRWNKRQ